MRRSARLGLTALVLAVGTGKGTGADLQGFAAINRGRYLAAAADCGSCHTIPGSNHPFSGGRPIETPFGILVSPNITPDRETGIGAWSDDEFDAAVRKGRRRDGKLLYPAMPFPYFARMSQQEVKDIRTYLATVEPVHNAVAVNQLPFPLNQRAVMMVWDRLYFAPWTFKDSHRNPRNGIVVHIWSRVPGIAVPVTRQRPSSAETSSPSPCRDTPSRAGSRPTSPAGRDRLGSGRSTISRNILRLATTALPPLPV